MIRACAIGYICFISFMSSVAADPTSPVEGCSLSYSERGFLGFGWKEPKTVTSPQTFLEDTADHPEWRNMSLDCGTGINAFWQVDLLHRLNETTLKAIAAGEKVPTWQSMDQSNEEWSKTHWQREFSRGGNSWALVDTEGSLTTQTFLHQCDGEVRTAWKGYTTCGQADPYLTARLFWPKGPEKRSCRFVASIKKGDRWFRATDAIQDCLPSTPEERGQALIKRAFEFQHLVDWLVAKQSPGDQLD